MGKDVFLRSELILKKNRQLWQPYDLFFSLGVFSQKQTAIDEGIADIKAGRIMKINNPKNLIEECLK